MLKKRVTCEFRAVSMSDPALAELSRERLTDYALTRDLDALTGPRVGEDGVAHTPLAEGTATVFVLSPLLSQYDRMADHTDADSAWFVFATHLRAIECDGGAFSPLEFCETNGFRRLADSMRDRFDPSLVAELATVIREYPGRDNRPFSPPDSWAQVLARHRFAAAGRASRGSATNQEG